MQIPDTIRPYLENILEQAEMTMLDDQMKEQLLQDLFYQLDNFLTSVIIDTLEKDDLEVFITMNEEGNSKEEIEEYVNKKIPNVQSVFSNAFISFERMYLENVSLARQKQTHIQ